MALFLVTYFLLYGSVHMYAYLKARHAFTMGSASSCFLAGFMLLMVIAPVLVRILEHHGMEPFARALAYTGYSWMGLLFLFFAVALSLDFYHFLIGTVGKVSGNAAGSLALSPKASFLTALCLATAAAIYGTFEARDIRRENVIIKTAKLPPGVGKLRIVQISDLHLGLIVREARVRRVVELIRQADPDLLVSTGDFVDGQIDGLTEISRLMDEIKPRFGKVAVIGNHESYAGLQPSLKITSNAGFRVLRNEGVVHDDTIAVAGVDDPASFRHDQPSRPREEQILSTLPRHLFTVLLKHRPMLDDHSIGKFDLQLSGHVHKGQIFPFNLLTHLFYPVKMGLSQLEGRAMLYVSRGTGTWGPPMRVMAPPEVTVIDLVRPDTTEEAD